MQMISEADAFRSRWAAHPVGWLLLLLPLTALVILQESETPFASMGPVLASALAQHVIAGGLVVGGGLLAHRLFHHIPLAFGFVLWAVSGVLRGLIGGWFAIGFAGVAPDFGPRIAYWVVASLVWMPLITYLLAQFALRRDLVGATAQVTARVHAATEAARHSTRERETELVTAVRDAVAPLIAEVRFTLRAAAENDSTIELGTISARLEQIADEARAIIVPPTEESRATVPAPAQLSPLVEALSFSRARPFFLSALTAVGVSAIFVIDSLRVGGPTETLEHLVSIGAGSLALALSLLAARQARRFTPLHALIAFLIAAAATQLTLAVVDTDVDSFRDRAMFAAIPLAFAAVASLISSAVGLALGNLKLVAVLEAGEAELRALRLATRQHDAEIADKVALVLHGPLLGRLSACIMALNFYLAEPEHSRGPRRDATTEGVLAHLELVAVDLEKLSSPGA